MKPLSFALSHRSWMLPAAALALAAWPSQGVDAAVPALSPAAVVYALFAACGLLSGFLSGLLGIGGSLIVVPAMYLLLPHVGVDAAELSHVAVGSSLAAMVPTAALAALTQWRKGALHTAWLRRLAPGMVVGALAGAMLALQLRGPVLALLFASQSLYYAWGLLRVGPPAPWRARVAAAWGRLPTGVAAPVAAGFCACAGMGAGSMTVPYLLAQRVPLRNATATSSALNLAIAVAGALALVGGAFHGGTTPPLCLPAALLVGGCALVSVRGGVACAHRLPLPLLRRVLGVVTTLGAAVLLLRTL